MTKMISEWRQISKIYRWRPVSIKVISWNLTFVYTICMYLCSSKKHVPYALITKPLRSFLVYVLLCLSHELTINTHEKVHWISIRNTDRVSTDILKWFEIESCIFSFPISEQINKTYRYFASIKFHPDIWLHIACVNVFLNKHILNKRG